MSTNPVALIAPTESDINAAAEKMIAVNCQRHNVSRENFPSDGVEEAKRLARQELEADFALRSNPLYERLKASEEAARQARLERDAALQVRPSTGGNSTGGTKDPHVVRAQLGEANYRALTDNGRLMSCGVDPSKVGPVELQDAKKIFGRGADTHFASNMMKQDAARYHYLKTIAVVMNIQGQ